MKTQSEIRAAFWESIGQRPGVKRSGYSQAGNPLYVRKTQNDYPCDIRCTFVDFVDYLSKSGEISESLANRATL